MKFVETPKQVAEYREKTEPLMEEMEKLSVVERQLLVLNNLLKTDVYEQGSREECYKCSHRRGVAGNAHFACVKPDLAVMGSPHGIQEGWFMYPMLFDPVWKQTRCRNFESGAEGKAVSHAVNRPVSLDA